MEKEQRVVVIGLDAAVPDLIFEKWKYLLPNLSAIIQKGISGKLKSCFPPITVPAWMCMFTGKDPGQLGIYGFRNRDNYDYSQLKIANSYSVKSKTIWDYCTDENKYSVVIGVPPTYPPKPLNGTLLSCFLTPQNSSMGIYPQEEWPDLMQLTKGSYIYDIYNFRKNSKEKILEDAYQMTEIRFNVAKEWLKAKKWDLFILIEIGLDRVQHIFWADHDPSHYLFKENNEFINSIRDYYIFLDKKIGELISIVPKNVSLLIVSDHGAKSMEGGFCINEWLLQNNYLKLKKYPSNFLSLEPELIDWQNTVAWAEGGYYGRLFLNINGREPDGIVNEYDSEKILNEIAQKLNSLKNIDGSYLEIQTYKAIELYKELNGIPPDLFIVFNNFSVRSLGSVGLNKLFIGENDLGADTANHDMDGIYMLRSDLINKTLHGEKIDASIYDIFPTIAELLKLKPPTWE